MSQLQYQVSRKSVITAHAENCHCRVTVTAYAGREDARFNIVRCSPRHRKIVDELKVLAERAVGQTEEQQQAS